MKKLAEFLKVAAAPAKPEQRDPSIDVEHRRMEARAKTLNELQARVRVIERRYK